MHIAFFKKLGKIIDRHRLAKQETLYKVAARFFDKIELFAGLDTLGNGLYIKVFSHSYDRIYNFLTLYRGTKLYEETAVQLDNVNIYIL